MNTTWLTALALASSLVVGCAAHDDAEPASSTGNLESTSPAALVQIEASGGMPQPCAKADGSLGPSKFVWRSVTVLDVEGSKVTRTITDSCKGPQPETSVAISAEVASTLAKEARGLSGGDPSKCSSDAARVDLRVVLADGTERKRTVEGTACSLAADQLVDEEAYRSLEDKVAALFAAGS